MTVSSLVRRSGAAVLGGALAVALMAGCGDSGDSGSNSDESPTPTTTSSGSADATETAATSYLPVPAGVTLTPAGTDLRLGQGATVAWRPRQDRVVALDLTVDRIDKTSFDESFQGWVVTKEMKGQTPYFVRVRATNESDGDAGGLLVPLYAQVDDTSMYEPLAFQKQEFTPCPGGVLPEKLEPGKSADLCFVYLLPAGTELQSAAFDLVGELAPITWTGEITSIEKPKKDKGGKKKDEKGDQPG
ncbi:hypothetical protein [Nocardioides sp. MH1]|uniref:hypothetical protein n=1 Tax=Nocardioides sp. MH1 TaxID=3242490 RepID=UPI0035223C49